MKCHKCENEILNDEFKKVADWAFCNDCFKLLLEKPKNNNQNKTNEKTETNDNKEKEKVSHKIECSICDNKIQGDEFKKFASFIICPKCFSKLIARPKLPVPDKIKKNNEPKKISKEKNKFEQVEVLLNKYTLCNNCKRKIPLGGSREIDKKPYCPECYSKIKTQDKDLNTRNKLKINLSDNSDNKDIINCESCGKKLKNNSYKTIEGFIICNPCLLTDVELAIKIAKKRHQKYMEELLNQ